MNIPTSPAADVRAAELAELVEWLTARLQAGEVIDWDEVEREYPAYAAEARGLLPTLALLAGLSRSSEATSALASADAVIGELGDFRLIREVGRGGMGIVYEAEQGSLGRRVALKVLPYAGALDPKQLQRFRNEARAAAGLHHEHIVPVHAVGCEKGVHFYAMQFIEGQTLADVIRWRAGRVNAPVPETIAYVEADRGVDTPRSPDTAPVAARTTERSGPRGREFYRTAARLMADAADALEHAHAVGIVHRDVKPGNLMLDHAGKVYVTDFGLARFGPDAGLTVSGDLLGTLRYMAPEQALARHGLVDHRADIYALGATLYELLTGRPAVDAAERAEILRRIAFEDPTPPRRLVRSVPAELETIALKCLAKSPAERYATAGELADDLRRFLTDAPIKAKPPTVVQRLARRLRRHPKAVVAAFVVTALAAVGASAGAVLIDQANQHTRDAYADVRAAYARARLALDEMSSQVIDDWLAKQPALTGEQRQFLERALAHYGWLAGRPAADAETRAGIAGAYLRAGDIRAKLGQMAEAEAAYARAVDLYGRLADEFPDESAYRLSQAQGLRARGTALRGLGRLSDASASLRSALALHERFFRGSLPDPAYRFELTGALLSYGNVLRQIGRCHDAVATFRRGLALFDGLPEPTASDRYRSGQLSIDLGSLLYWCFRHDAEAEKTVRRGAQTLEGLLTSVGNGPDTAAYRQSLADGYTELAHTLGTEGMGRLDEAEWADRQSVGTWEKLVADFPAVPEYRYHLTRSLIGLGNHMADAGRREGSAAAYRRAITTLEKLVAEYPDEPEYRATFLDGVARLGVFANAGAEAEAALQRAIALKPDALAYFNLGRLLHHQGRWAEAAAAFRETVTLKSDHPSAYALLGVALFRQGDAADAEVAFRKHTDLQPADAEAHFNLGIACRFQGKPAAAEEAFRKAVKVRPGYGEAYRELGQLLDLQGKRTEADAVYRQAVENDPKLHQLDAKLAQVLAGTAQPAGAAERVELAKLCAGYRRLDAAAARLFAQAFADQPAIQPPHRYGAACAAALAGCGQGDDAGILSEDERARLRRQALAWLRAELQSETRQLDQDPDRARGRVAQTLRHWQGDTDFAGVRGPESLAKLPEAERRQWQALWQDVSVLLRQADAVKPGP